MTGSLGQLTGWLGHRAPPHQEYPKPLGYGTSRFPCLVQARHAYKSVSEGCLVPPAARTSRTNSFRHKGLRALVKGPTTCNQYTIAAAVYRGLTPTFHPSRPERRDTQKEGF